MSPCSLGDYRYPPAMLLTHEAHGFGNVAIVAHHHSAVVRIEPAVVQQMHNEIDVGSLVVPGTIDPYMIPSGLSQT